MNTEDLGYYLFMDNEELNIKDQEEEIKEERKVNLELNPFFMRKSPTQDRLKERKQDDPKIYAPMDHSIVYSCNNRNSVIKSLILSEHNKTEVYKAFIIA